MCSDEYPITWNNHCRNVVEVFGRFLDEGTLIDCTIATQGESLKAHRLVLSACSPYFELLFSQEMKEKVVVLEDIKFEMLKSLIAFMYHGQVTVPKDRLQDFLRAAESLQIKGLPRDLVQSSWQAETQMSSWKEVSVSHVPHKPVRCSAIGDDSSDKQSENLTSSSIGRKQNRDKRSPTCIQTNISEENVCPLSQSVLESDCNRETVVFRVDEEPSVEPKEEVDVEDTPIWESEDENPSSVTDLFTSATAGEENRNESIPVLGTVNSSCSGATSPLILGILSRSLIPNLSSVNATASSSVNVAITSPFVLNIPNVQGGDAMTDSSSCVQAELPEQNICVNNNHVVKTEVVPATFPSNSESTVEPMHEVWVEAIPFWEGEGDEKDTAVIHSQETTHQGPDVDATSDQKQPNVWSNLTVNAFSSVSMVDQRDKKKVNVQEIKIEESEMNEQHMEQYCRNISTNDCAIGKVVKSGQHGVIYVDEDEVEMEGHEIEGQDILVGSVDKAFEADTVLEQNVVEGEEDSTPLSERISKMFGKKSHKCLRCPNVFRTGNDLQVHVKEVHSKELPNRCEVCLATFAYKSRLVIHMRKHTGERPFQCNICTMSFRVKNYLTVHERIHTGERPFHCDICKMSFNRVAHLAAHRRNHTGERPFKCDVCERSFNERCSLIRHQRKHTGECSFQCEVCKRSFNEMSSLIRHKRKHTGERPFECDVCKMSFSQGGHLTSHKRIHTGERPFECDVCKISFSRLAHLTTHKRNHTGERPYQCEVCEWSFSVRRNLTRHLRIHTGERPFQCDVCKRSFSQMAHLTAHRRIHTGERPFQCEVCKRSFSERSKLTRHKQKHSGECPFQCKICKRFFSFQSSLISHMQSHTG